MTGEDLQRRLSVNIKKFRRERFTQETLAEESGISWQMMNNIEGCRRWPSENTLVKIAAALGIDVGQLFVPAAEESEEISAVYKEISCQVIRKVRDAVESALKGCVIK